MIWQNYRDIWRRETKLLQNALDYYVIIFLKGQSGKVEYPIHSFEPCIKQSFCKILSFHGDEYSSKDRLDCAASTFTVHTEYWGSMEIWNFGTQPQYYMASQHSKTSTWKSSLIFPKQVFRLRSSLMPLAPYQYVWSFIDYWFYISDIWPLYVL